MKKKFLYCSDCKDKKWHDRLLGLNYICRQCKKLSNLRKLMEVGRDIKGERKKPLKIEPTYVKKQTREEDETYLRFIRGQTCLMHGANCFGIIHAHHVVSRGAGGSDYTCVPLCFYHHQKIHLSGKETFQRLENVDLEKHIKRLNLLFKLREKKE